MNKKKLALLLISFTCFFMASLRTCFALHLNLFHESDLSQISSSGNVIKKTNLLVALNHKKDQILKISARNNLSQTHEIDKISIDENIKNFFGVFISDIDTHNNFRFKLNIDKNLNLKKTVITYKHVF